MTGGPVSDGFVTVEGLPPVVMHHSHESQFGRPSRRSRARWLFVVHLVIASRRCSAASSPRTPAVRRSAYTLGHNIDLNPCRFCSVSRAHAGVGKKRNINRPPAISCNPQPLLHGEDRSMIARARRFPSELFPSALARAGSPTTRLWLPTQCLRHPTTGRP